MRRFFKKHTIIFLCISNLLLISFIFISGSNSPGFKAFETKSTLEKELDQLAEECRSSTLDKSEKILCWEGIIERAILGEGIEYALNLVRENRKKDPLFASDCHVFMHLLGEISFWRMQDTSRAELIDDEISMCAYGFYHGFMMEFGHHGENFLERAPDLCEYFADNYIEENVEDTRNQCYHGIGHGLIFLYVDELDSDKALVKRARNDCFEMVDGQRLKNCIYGVYGGIASLYFGTHGYFIEMDQEDPLSVCHTEPEKYKEGCYVSMAPPILIEQKFSFGDSFNILSQNTSNPYKGSSVEYLALVATHELLLKEDGVRKAIEACNSLSQDFKHYCIKGFARGLVEYSLPDEFIKNSRTFCESETFLPSQKEVCFDALFGAAKRMQGKESLDKLCSQIRYKGYCE